MVGEGGLTGRRLLNWMHKPPHRLTDRQQTNTRGVFDCMCQDTLSINVSFMYLEEDSFILIRSAEGGTQNSFVLIL